MNDLFIIYYIIFISILVIYLIYDIIRNIISMYYKNINVIIKKGINMDNKELMSIIYERHNALVGTIKILEEMTKEDMLKAGYSKSKIRAMSIWLESTKSILRGLEKEYFRQYNDLKSIENGKDYNE